MDPHSGKILINGATSQGDRWLRALEVDYAKADGRTLAQLLDFAIGFGALINFYNQANRIDGNWEEFFLCDPAMVLASIVATDLASIEAEFLRLEGLIAAEPSARKRRQLVLESVELLFGMARQIDLWMRGLEICGDTGAVRGLGQSVAAAINDGLAKLLRETQDHHWSFLPEEAPAPEYERFHGAWGVCERHGKRRAPHHEHHRAHAEPPCLSPIFNAFRDAAAEWKRFAEEHLEEALAAPGHKPHIALYIAFARLFQKAQDSINSFTGRFAQFYYRALLRQTNRAAVPDRVYLTFTAAPVEGPVAVVVPKCTLFSAGQDAAGSAILYASDRDLTVTNASLAKLCTLRIEKGPLWDRQPAPATDLAQRVLASEIPVGGAAAFPTFGAADLANLGFGIGSDCLMLSGGLRTVSVEIRYGQDFLDATLAPRLLALHGATGLATDAILCEILAAAFALNLSTAGAWYPVEAYAAESIPASEKEPGFSLGFTLAVTAPPIAPCGLLNPAPNLPTLLVCLRQEPVMLSGPGGAVEVYPLALLGGMPVISIRIGTDVSGLNNLSLENTNGPVDPTKPAPVFGAVPALGSYLRIRHSEIFRKTVSALSIRIKWFNLPKNNTGFQGYYRDYVIGPNGGRCLELFDNQSFRANITVTNPSTWSLDAPDRYLFRTLPDCSVPIPQRDGKLCGETLLQFSATPAVPAGPVNLETAALRVELSRPDYGFGQDLYAQNVLNAALRDLADPGSCAKKCAAEFVSLADAINTVNGLLQNNRKTRGPFDLWRFLDDLFHPRRYRQFVTAALGKLHEALLKVAGDKLAEFLNEWKDLLSDPPEQFEKLQAALKDCPPKTPEDREECLFNLLKQVQQLAEQLPATALPGMQKCRTFLDAAMRVCACETSCGHRSRYGYRRCMGGSLAQCLAQLQELETRSIKACTDACMSAGAVLRYPNPPHVPQMEKVTLDYTASSTLDGESGRGLFFHMLPFDGYLVQPLSAAGKTPLLPAFAHAANLFLGFRQLTPPQTLTLLFQMAAYAGGDGSQPAPPMWEYLTENHWMRLETPVAQADSTNGLRNTGIVTLALPPYSTGKNTVLPGDFEWLRIAVTEDPDGFPATTAIYPHAVLCTWQVSGAGDHLKSPLPPFRIAAFVKPVLGIAGVLQPVESFGGRPAEDGRAFQMRMGERLRHKDRAILAWDYERLALERFPTIWKAKALPARVSGQITPAPGNVLLVALAGPDGAEIRDPTAPAATAETLEQIRMYLQAAASPFVKVGAANPVWVRIQASASLQFQEGEDPGACIKRLNGELMQYLSPWAHGKDEGYASEAAISEFIQMRPYVAALVSISFRYAPDVKALDWYFLTTAEKHDLKDATAVAVEDLAGY